MGEGGFGGNKVPLLLVFFISVKLNALFVNFSSPPPPFLAPSEYIFNNVDHHYIKQSV